jgi:hypothetical protein
VILLSGMIANSSVLANAYRVIDERLEKCFPCEVVKPVPEKKAGKAVGRKKTGALRTKK